MDTVRSGPSAAAPAPLGQIPKSKLRAVSDFKTLARRWGINQITLAAEFGVDRNHKFWQELIKLSTTTPWPGALAALTRARLKRKTVPRLSRITRWVITDINLCREELAEHAALSDNEPDEQDNRKYGDETGEPCMQDPKHQEDLQNILAEAPDETDKQVEQAGEIQGQQQDQGAQSMGSGLISLADMPLEQPVHNIASEKNPEQGRKQDLSAAQTSHHDMISPLFLLQQPAGRRQKQVKFQHPPATSRDDNHSTEEHKDLSVPELESATSFLLNDESEQDHGEDWAARLHDDDDDDDDNNLGAHAAADAGDLDVGVKAGLLPDGSDHFHDAFHDKHEPPATANARMEEHTNEAMQMQKTCSLQVTGTVYAPFCFAEFHFTDLKLWQQTHLSQARPSCPRASLQAWRWSVVINV